MPESADDVAHQLASARAGSRDALGRALQMCRKYLLLVAEKELDPDVRAKGGASDLVQETFLEAQRDFGNFRGATEAELLGWLRQMLVNNIANFTRRFHGTGKRDLGREVGLAAGDASGDPLGLASPERTPSSQAVEREQSESLHRALARLPEDYRRVITLRHLEHRSFEEIGQLMERSAQAARKLWLRAMAQLRREWEGAP